MVQGNKSLEKSLVLPVHESGQVGTIFLDIYYNRPKCFTSTFFWTSIVTGLLLLLLRQWLLCLLMFYW